MRIFFSVGEPSGDTHGANLIADLHAIDPTIECVGFGGPKMAAAGCQLHEDLTQYAVMWFVRVLAKLPTFLRLVRDAKRYFAEHAVDAVVLIDYPGFNWHIAAAAKAHGIPVYYYGAPQMWAWASWRVHKMRRLVDHVLCKLAFEPAWYAERGVTARYLGHPFFDEVARRTPHPIFVANLRRGPQGDHPTPVVALLPGSRRQEVTANFPDLVRTADLIHQAVPGVRFAVAAFNPRQAQMMRHYLETGQFLSRSSANLDEGQAAVGLVERAPGQPALPIHVGRTPEIMTAATCAVAVSGSVSLELLAAGTPTVITYRVGRFFYWFAWTFFVQVKYITLVNLLADPAPFAAHPKPYDPASPDAASVPFPEYPSADDRTRDLARHVVSWLTDADALAARRRMLASLREQIVRPGASRRAAFYITETLAGRSPTDEQIWAVGQTVSIPPAKAA